VKNPEGLFDAFHVRRGDFQYQKTRVSAEEILKMAKKKLTEGTTLFIATDERKKEFFDPLKEHYRVFFLDDFHDQLEGINTNYYGMIDQLVASRSRIFYGCWFSTFTVRSRPFATQEDVTIWTRSAHLYSLFFWISRLGRATSIESEAITQTKKSYLATSKVSSTAGTTFSQTGSITCRHTGQ
jgi:hypothetical protein